MKTFCTGIVGIWIVVALFVGCATNLQPGADPLTVRVEQGETIGLASFNFVVNFDDSDRGFWRTNAPAFHDFAEWLRTPIQSHGQTQRRGLAMLNEVDSAKVEYQNDHSKSNALLIVFSALTQASEQAQAWRTIVTTKTP